MQEAGEIGVGLQCLLRTICSQKQSEQITHHRFLRVNVTLVCTPMAMSVKSQDRVRYHSTPRLVAHPND
jgi:hypothetical protein